MEVGFTSEMSVYFYETKLATSQKAVTFIFTAVKTSNLTELVPSHTDNKKQEWRVRGKIRRTNTVVVVVAVAVAVATVVVVVMT
jgi:hypothetical protein